MHKEKKKCWQSGGNNKNKGENSRVQLFLQLIFAQKNKFLVNCRYKLPGKVWVM